MKNGSKLRAHRTEISKVKDPVERLFCFIHERYQIFLKKEEGQKPPWTDDWIMQNYRFTNVYREDDAVTRWIAGAWRDPHFDDPDLWFAMCVARLLNQPDTLDAIGYPVPFDYVRFGQILRRWQADGHTVFNAAYIVSTNGISINKLAYICHDVLTPLWKRRKELRPKLGDSLNAYHMLLGQMNGFGSFMSGQVVADLKYVQPLKDARDWWTFAASGPGSRRGLNYVLGRDRKSPWNEDEWRLAERRLREDLLPMFERAQMPTPHAQDVQNCLCEWSKYWGACEFGKMPKRLYKWR
jgi:hypothetical protein